MLADMSPISACSTRSQRQSHSKAEATADNRGPRAELLREPKRCSGLKDYKTGAETTHELSRAANVESHAAQRSKELNERILRIRRGCHKCVTNKLSQTGFGALVSQKEFHTVLRLTHARTVGAVAQPCV